MHVQSKKQNSYFAKITLLCGSFLDLGNDANDSWKTKIHCADVIHLDNWNWWKSQLPAKEAIIPQSKGNSDMRKSTDSNVAFLLRRHAKMNAIVLVYLSAHFQIGFKTMNQLNVKANWNSKNSKETTDVFFLQNQQSIAQDVVFNAKQCSKKNGFTCDCGMIFEMTGRLRVEEIYLCKSCEVSSL
jgi:hypothetical protein